MTPFRTFLLLSLGGVAACTTFNGLSAGDGGSPAAKNDGGHVTIGDDDDDSDLDATTHPDGGTSDGSTLDAPFDSGQAVSYLTLDVAAALCTRFQSCDYLSDSIQDSMGIPVLATETQNFSACVDALAGPLPPKRPGIALQSLVLGCVVNATSCLAAKACLSYEDLDTTDSRCAGKGNDELCSGTDYELCDYGAIFHCGNAAYVGSQCINNKDAGPECVKDNTCPVNSTCSTPTVSDYCTNLGGHAQFDCSIYGDYCDIAHDDAGPFSDCFQAAGEEQAGCDEDKTTCDAKNRVSVCGGAVISVYDCTALGETCVAGASSVSCVPPGAECNPSSAGINVCTGDSLSICVGGVKSTIDCTQYGAFCKSPGVGINSYCAPNTDGGAADAD